MDFERFLNIECRILHSNVVYCNLIWLKKIELNFLKNQTSTKNSSRPYFLFKKAASCKCLLERIWIGWCSLSRQIRLKLESFNWILLNFNFYGNNSLLSYQNYPFPELLQRQAGPWKDFFTNLARNTDLPKKFVQSDETASILTNTRDKKLLIFSRFYA